MTTRERTWSIAELAGEFDVTHRTLRHYEDLGLLNPARQGTARVFTRRDHTRLSLILRGRRLGFALDEIRKIVDMYDDQPGKVGQLQYLLSQITDRREDLQARRKDIDDSLSELAELERRCIHDLESMDTRRTEPVY